MVENGPQIKVRLVMILLTVLFFFLGSCRDNPDRPNIIVIYTDDQGYGDVSSLNPGSKFQTPNIDRLATEGIVFTDGHSSSTVCTPSRYGLLTGRYSWRTALKEGVLGADGDCLIEDGRTTLATICKKAGYLTAFIGKWHLQMQYPGEKGDRDWTKPITDGPRQKGFDYYFGMAASMNFGILTFTENENVTEIPSRWTNKKHITKPYIDFRFCPPYDDRPVNIRSIEVAPSFRDDRVLETLTIKAVDFIAENASAAKKNIPFFLFFSLTSPHLPHSVHPDFIGRSGIGKYGDFMIETDWRIGQILKALAENEIDRNTLIFFSSDNGAEINYRYYRDSTGHFCNYHFRGGKRDIYEGGHRVPFIIRWPDKFKPGTSGQLVGQTDILATIADLLNIELAENEGEDSYSLLPVLLDPESGKSKRQSIIHQDFHGYLAYREGKWKLCITRDHNTGMTNYELFNLDQDIQEKNNLYGELSLLENRLKDSLARAILNGRTTPGNKQYNNGGEWWPQLFWMSGN